MADFPETTNDKGVGKLGGRAMPDLEVVEVSPPDRLLLEKIGRLRVRAWATEIAQAARLETWLDRFDIDGRRWVIFRGNEPVAAARMTIHRTLAEVPEPEIFDGVFSEPLPTPIASINRLVVDPSARGLGLSRRLDSCRLEAAESSGCRCVIGESISGERRVNQLKSLGFQVAGDGIPYQGPNFYAGRPSLVLICHLPRPAALKSVPRTTTGPSRRMDESPAGPAE
jgi:hypothetical protein